MTTKVITRSQRLRLSLRAEADDPEVTFQEQVTPQKSRISNIEKEKLKKPLLRTPQSDKSLTYRNLGAQSQGVLTQCDSQKEKNETKKSATQRLKLQSRSKNRRSSKDNRRSILEVVYQGMTEAETIEDTAHICVPSKPKEKSPNRKPQQQSPNTPKGKMPKGSRKTWE